jgi:hypothetical protein
MLSIYYKALVCLLLIFLFAVFSVPESLGQSTAKKLDAIKADPFGQVLEDKYSNDFYGFSLPVPKDYVVIGQEESKILANAGGDLLKNDNSGKSKTIDKAIAAQATVFVIAEKSIGSVNNAILEIIVVKQQKGVTANMALASSIALTTSTGKLKLIKAISNPRFGSRPFAGALMSGEFNTLVLKQEMYVIMRRGYSVHFGLTYSTDEGRRNMINILNQLQFTN